MDEYYLFSNSVREKEIETNYPVSLNIYNDHEIYSYINNSVKSICRSKSHVEFDRFLESFFYLVDGLRAKTYFNTMMLYYNFYMTITTIDYHMDRYKIDSTVIDFIKEHDFTAIYYNYAYLYYINGDNYNYLHYLSLADNEYSLKKGCNKGEFVNYLIRSKGYLLWNLVPNILSDYQNFKSANQHSSNFELTLSQFEISLDESLIRELFLDFSHDLLLQAIHVFKNFSSLSTSYNFRELHNKNGDFKSIKTTRFIGELTWLFEVYLKDKLIQAYPDESFHAPLDPTIQAFLLKINKDYCKEYSQITNSFHDKFKNKDSANTTGITYLLKEVQSHNHNGQNTYLISLFILKLFRNFYSHYMDRENKWGSSYFSNLELKIVIYNCFLITKVMFDRHLELHET